MPTNENANFNELFVRDRIISTGPVELADKYRNPILKTNGNGPVEVLDSRLRVKHDWLHLGGAFDGGILFFDDNGTWHSSLRWDSTNGATTFRDDQNSHDLMRLNEGGPVKIRKDLSLLDSETPQAHWLRGVAHGGSKDPGMQFHDGIGFYSNGNGEVLVVDSAGNTTTLS